MSPADPDAVLMREALREARLAADEDEVPIGAVVVAGGSVISRGRNRVQGWADATGHAEIIALREAFRLRGEKFLYGCTLYSTVEPCMMCLGGMVLARIDRLVYGTEEPKTGAVVSRLRFSELTLNHTVVVRGGVLAMECRQLMRGFFADKR